MQVEGIRLFPLLGKQLLPFRVGFQEQQQRVRRPAGAHPGVLYHPVLSLLVSGVVALARGHIHAPALVERYRQQSSLVRQHPVPFYLLTDAYQPYGLHVLGRHILLAILRRGVGLPVLALRHLFQALRHVGMSQTRILFRLARRPHGGSGNVYILLPQPVVLLQHMLIKSVAQQRLQCHRFLLIQVAEQHLRLVPACRRHQVLYLILCCY